ncbi:unnamed protein product [Adineta ricciae]|uniref:Uncharacterized protein n=1 Tax=Adineta ricciae TaxID=249248 RepID=A0A816G2V3_ADIRI|nr:unnamed protein product [Adineta ricciae]CAF1668959.1 unnamed protein product [Adineta ricciae]
MDSFINNSAHEEEDMWLSEDDPEYNDQDDIASTFTNFMRKSLRFQKKQDIYLRQLSNAQVYHGKILKKTMIILDSQAKTLEETNKMLKEGNEKPEKIVEKGDTYQVAANKDLLSINKDLFYKESPV